MARPLTAGGLPRAVALWHGSFVRPWLLLCVSAALGCDLDALDGILGEPPAAHARRRRARRAAAPALAVPAAAPLPQGPAQQSGSVQVAMGLPVDASPHDELLLTRSEYVTSYNRYRNAPNWVAWRVTAGDLGTTGRTRNRFAPDPLLPAGVYRVLDGDYAGSGYDRGHLCPSAARTADPESNAATFYTTNIVPQRHDLNAGAWENLEAWTHQMARRGWDAFVVAGGVWSAACDTTRRAAAPDGDCLSIGRSNDPARRVAVPVSTWKVIVLVPQGSGPSAVTAESPVVAVDMPNDGSAGADWHRYVTTVDALEARTGYELLGNVSAALQQWVEARPYRGE